MDVGRIFQVRQISHDTGSVLMFNVPYLLNSCYNVRAPPRSLPSVNTDSIKSGWRGDTCPSQWQRNVAANINPYGEFFVSILYALQLS